ncbi:MAG: hypothetical protein AAFX87_07425 [Bacteroidota bacterium]
MNKYLYKLNLVLCGVAIIFLTTSCDDDEFGALVFTDPPVSEINGSASVELGSSSVQYTVTERRGSSYSWAVEGASLATGSPTDSLGVFVDFNTVATGAVVTVTETDERGLVGTTSFSIQITNSAPTALLSFDQGSARDGDVITVTATFDFPIETTGTLPQISTDKTSNNLSPTNMTVVDDQTATFDLTIEGFGIDSIMEINISNATRSLGGTQMVQRVFQYKVDNTSPSATLTFDAPTDDDGNILATDGITVLITATFNEALTEAPMISHATIGGIAELMPTEMTATANARVWTFEYASVGGGTGIPDFELSSGTDEAGNEVDADPEVPSALNIVN